MDNVQNYDSYMMPIHNVLHEGNAFDIFVRSILTVQCSIMQRFKLQ
jgi:hypothetical protein